MKWNREVVAFFVALLVFVLGLWGVIQGLVATQIRVPNVTLRSSSREVIPRQYRSFTLESEPGRNPFSFSEGWERMEPPLSNQSLARTVQRPLGRSSARMVLNVERLGMTTGPLAQPEMMRGGPCPADQPTAASSGMFVSRPALTAVTTTSPTDMSAGP